MDRRDLELDRLLRAAAHGTDAHPTKAPFGFDTRVMAASRSQRSQSGADFWEFARIFRRITIAATLVMACASAGAFWQLQQNRDLDEPATSAYAIADTAIEAGAWQ